MKREIFNSYTNMKKTVSILMVIFAILLTAPVCQAQFRFGVQGGIVVNKLKFDDKAFSSDNRTGWTAGLRAELNIPVTGLGVAASVLYSHRNDAFSHESVTYRRDYIEIPVHLKYGLTLPAVSNIIIPYAFTGPNFAFLCDESKDIKWDNKSFVTSWDVGFGVELIKHIQLQASYGIGITDAFKRVDIEKEGTVITGKDRCWTITAAYLF